MPIGTTQELFYLISAIAVFWIAGFLCWTLYEIARMVRQWNTMISETRERIGKVEQAVVAIRERLESGVNYMGVAVEGAKALISYFSKRQEKKKRGRKGE